MDKWTSNRTLRDTIKAKLDEDHDSDRFAYNPLTQFFSHPNGQPLGRHDLCGVALPPAQPGTISILDMDAMQERAARHRELGNSHEIAAKNTVAIAQKARESFNRLKGAAERYAIKHSLPIKGALDAVRERLAQYNNTKYEERLKRNQATFSAEFPAQGRSSNATSFTTDDQARKPRSASLTRNNNKRSARSISPNSKRTGRSLSVGRKPNSTWNLARRPAPNP